MQRRSSWTFLLSAMTIGFNVMSAAHAGDDKSQYSLFNPTPDSALRPFTPDRPAKATTPITLDAGRLQIESDFLNFSVMQREGTSTSTLEALDPVIKLGVTDSIEFDLSTAGLLHDWSTGQDRSRDIGVGDTTLLTKFNLFGNDDGKYAFALIPYLRLPSGDRHFSDGQVEGGLIAPLSLSLPNDFTVVLQTEVDALANASSPGTHAAFTNILNVSHPVPGIDKLTGIVEFYSSISTEHHSDDDYTVDAALAYLITPDVQLDLGTNIRISRDVPDYQVYTGIAHRF